MPVLKSVALVRWAVTAVIASGVSTAAPAIERVSVPPGNGIDESTPQEGAALAPSFKLIEHRRPGAEQRGLPQPMPKPRDLHLASSVSRRTSPTPRDRVLVFIRAAELQHRIPAGLLDALVAIESDYRPFAVSRAGAAGLSQLMPGTARDLGVSDRFDVRANLDGGARYLRAMLDQFGTVALALAAYNAGPNAVARSRGIPLNGETPAYVARVIARWRAITSGR